jgi:hypothetical protein
MPVPARSGTGCHKVVLERDQVCHLGELASIESIRTEAQSETSRVGASDTPIDRLLFRVATFAAVWVVRDPRVRHPGANP